ncbi:putative sulfate exporter family transporter, partial [Streptomyces sp. NPDC059389]|uniref:putative sulfate exporter family transporter n=1 Tax=Streptomyces sp. NPDC059389 TaxID=3346818 RepID=UPI0036C2B7FD
MALLNRPVRGADTEGDQHVSRETSSSWPGLGMAAAGVLVAWCVHRLVPAVPMLTASVVLGIAAAHLPGIREVVRGAARPGLSLAGRRLMRIGIVLLGLGLGLDQVLRLGWATVAMVVGVVAATFFGT